MFFRFNPNFEIGNKVELLALVGLSMMLKRNLGLVRLFFNLIRIKIHF